MTEIPKYNYMAFIPEEVEKGLHLDLIKTLLDINNKSEDHFNEIHITTDSYCTIVEWVYIPIDRSYGGKFEFIDEDEYIEKWNSENKEKEN